MGPGGRGLLGYPLDRRKPAGTLYCLLDIFGALSSFPPLLCILETSFNLHLVHGFYGALLFMLVAQGLPLDLLALGARGTYVPGARGSVSFRAVLATAESTLQHKPVFLRKMAACLFRSLGLATDCGLWNGGQWKQSLFSLLGYSCLIS